MAVFQFIEGFYNPHAATRPWAIFRPSNTKGHTMAYKARLLPTRPPKRGNSIVRLFPEGNRRYGEQIRDAGRREHEGAGRPSIDSGLRARARYIAAPCDFPGCAASADQ